MPRVTVPPPARGSRLPVHPASAGDAGWTESADPEPVEASPAEASDVEASDVEASPAEASTPGRPARWALAAVGVLAIGVVHFRPWQGGMLEDWLFALVWSWEGISGFEAPLMLPDTSVDTTEDGQPAVSTVVVQKFNGKGYDTVQAFQ